MRLNKAQQGTQFATNLYSGTFTPGEDPKPADFQVQLSVIQGLGTASSTIFEPRDAKNAPFVFANFMSGSFIDVQDDDFPPVRVCAGNIP